MSTYQPVQVLEKDENVLQETEIKLYKRRWVMLLLFFLCCVGNTMQYIQYCIIADTVVKYYGVSYIAVDWSAMVFLLLYIPFLCLGIYTLDKTNFRVTIIIGTVGTCAGAWIKAASVSPDRFWILILGQSVVGISEIFIIGLSAQLSAVWFGPKEVSSACSVGVNGIQVGIAMGSLIPPLFVDGAETQEAIEEGLFLMSIVVAAFNSVLLLVILCVFQTKPPLPPSLAQAKIIQNKGIGFVPSMKVLFSNKDFVLLLLAYGLHAGVVLTVLMLLNQIVLENHPNAAVDAGRLGLCKIFAGVASSVAWGVVLDKSKQFKKVFLAAYAASLLGLIVFAFTIDKQLSIVYPGIIVTGLLMEAVYVIGYEIAAELTYPVPEGTSGGIITSVANLFAIIFTYLYSFLVDNMSSRLSNLAMFVMLTVGLISVACMPFNLRRQKLQITT